MDLPTSGRPTSFHCATTDQCLSCLPVPDTVRMNAIGYRRVHASVDTDGAEWCLTVSNATAYSNVTFLGATAFILHFCLCRQKHSTTHDSNAYCITNETTSLVSIPVNEPFEFFAACRFIQQPPRYKHFYTLLLASHTQQY